ncbi:hypothetical protein BAE44_0015542 [Dichanthelium oligosanthes]|uniref:RING-type domain-containing protein n=1 Tax=Dichanthelium oligosanthes TaxID=888268 RepID=A0A1E5VE63_9POAL|nr:hypothetical protein BAE44_0015542 [Dichanthelium oligosanthes]
MAVQQARLAGGLAGFPPPCAGLVDEQMRALKDYGALLPAAAADNWCQYDRAAVGVASAAQSELTCNGGGGAAAVPSRKRAREDELQSFVPPSSAVLLPIPGTHEAFTVAQRSPVTMGAVITSRMAESAVASTSGRPATATAAASVADELVAEMCRHDLEIDALVRAECDRLRAGLEHAQQRQRLALVRAAAGSAARRLREKEAELEVALRRAADLEDRLRQAAAESQAWCGAARSNEAVAAGLRATLETLLLRGAGAGSAPAELAEEGFGDSDPDDAQSRCFVVDAEDAPVDAAATATSSGNSSKLWVCRACGGGEAWVLLLPCRHLCLCKACEPLADACPICLAAKSASIHVAAD